MAAATREQRPRSLYGRPVDSVNIDRGQSIHVLQGQAGPIPAAAPERTHRFCLAQHPQFLLSYAGDALCSKIQLRKRITVWPVQFKFCADYSRRLRAFQYGFSCKDRLLKGSLHLNIQNQQLEYRKLLRMNGGGALAVTAACSLAGIAGQESLRPMIGLQWHMGGHGAASITSGGAIDIRRKVPLTRHVGVELCGSAEFPLPQAQYAMQEDESRFSFGSDDGTPFHLHLDQVNLRLEL